MDETELRVPVRYETEFRNEGQEGRVTCAYTLTFPSFRNSVSERNGLLKLCFMVMRCEGGNGRNRVACASALRNRVSQRGARRQSYLRLHFNFSLVPKLCFGTQWSAETLFHGNALRGRKWTKQSCVCQCVTKQ